MTERVSLKEIFELAVYLFLLPFIILYSSLEDKIWNLKGQPCINCGYKLKNVKFSESVIGLHKHCPKCDTIHYFEIV